MLKVLAYLILAAVIVAGTITLALFLGDLLLFIIPVIVVAIILWLLLKSRFRSVQRQQAAMASSLPSH